MPPIEVPQRPAPATPTPTPAVPATRAASGGVQSLQRAFGLLELMADAGGETGLSELAASSGLPLPTIHRLMRTLVACGYVRQQANRRYALGPRLIRLGESAARPLTTWARPHLARLVEETGETANMALLDGDEVVYVAQVPSRHSMRMFTEVGRRVLPHATGVGKALLAYAPPEVLAAHLRRPLRRCTAYTITEPGRLARELATVRERGWARTHEEMTLGSCSVAVPVRDATGAVLAAIGVVGHSLGTTPRQLVPALLTAADRIAARLADTPPVADTA